MQRNIPLDQFKEELVSVLVTYISSRLPSRSCLTDRDMLGEIRASRIQYNDWGTGQWYKDAEFMKTLTFERLQLAVTTIDSIRAATSIEELIQTIESNKIINAQLSAKHLKSHSNHNDRVTIFNRNISHLANAFHTCLEMVVEHAMPSEQMKEKESKCMVL